MPGYGDSLRGYGHETHKKYKFTCQYCGYDGRPFPNWLQLTVDHIVPLRQGGPGDEDNKITVCHACNSITSRMTFSGGKSKEEIIAKKKQRVQERQSDYLEFWKNEVAPLYIQRWKEDERGKKR